MFSSRSHFRQQRTVRARLPLCGHRFPARHGAGADMFLQSLSMSRSVSPSVCLLTNIFLHLTAVGFEPTPLRNGALGHRLRPLGQIVMPEGVARRCVSLRLSLAPLSTQSFSMNKCATICKYLFIAKYLLCFLCLQTHR